MNNFFDNQRILDIIWNRKFHFLIIGGIAVLLSAIFSGSAFITPKYKSTARIYPTNNIATFSNESESEQVLEIINSRDIKLRMFDAFALDKVYRIKKEDPQYLTYMMDKYNTNVSTSKTEYETIEIKVLDEDPRRASNMCDSLIHFFNQKVKSLHSAKHLELVAINNRFISDRQRELDSISGYLNEIRQKTGIINYNTFTEAVTKNYMRALAANTSRTEDGRKLKLQYDNLLTNGTNVALLEKRFGKLSNLIDSLRMVVKVDLSEANKNITYCHVVENPIPADKKSYPIRWLIVAVATISSVFLALLLFLILDYRKKD